MRLLENPEKFVTPFSSRFSDVRGVGAVRLSCRLRNKSGITDRFTTPNRFRAPRFCGDVDDEPHLTRDAIRAQATPFSTCLYVTASKIDFAQRLHGYHLLPEQGEPKNKSRVRYSRRASSATANRSARDRIRGLILIDDEGTRCDRDKRARERSRSRPPRAFPFSIPCSKMAAAGGLNAREWRPWSKKGQA